MKIPGAARVSDGAFKFLNATRPFAGEERWRPRAASKLWIYQLHCFQYLPQVTPTRARRLIEDWLNLNPPGTRVAWDPYPISLRLREWIEWLVANPALDASFQQRVIDSIVHQTAVLESRLEYHLMANHLLENAISLCWSGVSLDGPLAERWRKNGLRLLGDELAEQVLPDGTHYERCAMYQAAIAENLLRLAGVAARSPGAGAPHIARISRLAGKKLVESLEYLCHPDADFALLNDCVLGQAPRLSELRDRFAADYPGLAQSVQAGLWHLRDSGFMGWNSGEGSYLIVDAGDLQPSYNPGHAHAGLLSFELSHRGRRVFTDTGVFSYNDSLVRRYDRGTSAHNTIQVDGCDQSELWRAFRFGRRARITERVVDERSSGGMLRAAYRGSLGGLGSVRHSRTIRILDTVVTFNDLVEARGAHSGVLRLHVSPGVRVNPGRELLLVEEASGRPLAKVSLAGGDWQLGTSPYHPEFGRELDRVSLEASFDFRDRVSLDWTIRLL